MAAPPFGNRKRCWSEPKSRRAVARPGALLRLPDTPMPRSAKLPSMTNTGSEINSTCLSCYLSGAAQAPAAWEGAYKGPATGGWGCPARLRSSTLDTSRRSSFLAQRSAALHPRWLRHAGCVASLPASPMRNARPPAGIDPSRAYCRLEAELRSGRWAQNKAVARAMRHVAVDRPRRLGNAPNKDRLSFQREAICAYPVAGFGPT